MPATRRLLEDGYARRQGERQSLDRAVRVVLPRAAPASISAGFEIVTKATRCPARASATARFATVVDFPSCWTALVTMIVRTLRSRLTKSRFVRRTRNG